MSRQHETHDELLDHEADGIREFDNALPRWWLYGFYFTIAFAVVYVINYHVLASPYLGARSVAAEYDADMKAHPKAGGAAGLAVIPVLTDQASLAAGKAIFESQTNPCQACHRPDLGGLVGPNLTDNTWLHGCSLGAIVKSIQTGYPAMGMLPYGGGAPLSAEQLQQLGSYILSKQGSHPPNPKVSDPARDQPCQ